MLHAVRQSTKDEEPNELLKIEADRGLRTLSGSVRGACGVFGFGQRSRRKAPPAQQ